MSAPLYFEPSVGNPLCWFTAAVPAGAVLDPPEREGFTRHVLELSRRGAGGLDRAQLDGAVDQLGATLDMELDRDYVALSGSCLERNLDRTVALAAKVLADPAMDPHEHEVLARETLHELDDVRDDDGSLIERWFQHLCAPGHPYGRTAVGTADSIARFDLGAAGAHHRSMWAAGHLVVGVAGPVTQARAREVAGALEAAVAGREAAARPALEVPAMPRGRRLYVIDKPQRTQCQVLVGHLAPRYGTDDFVALMPLETAFGGLFSSRLMQEIRVARGWSYGAGCRMRRARASYWFRMWLAPTREVAPEALALTLELYERLAESGITGDELSMAVRHLSGGLPFSLATARQRMRVTMRHVLTGLPSDYAAGLDRALAGVTLEQVHAAAGRWLRPRDLCIAMVASADEMVPRLEAVGLSPTEVVPYDQY